MLPIVLDLSSVNVMLVGNNDRTINRLHSLDSSQAKNVKVFSDNPSDALAKMAGDRLINRLPTRDEIKDSTVVLIAGLQRDKLSELATIAKEEKKIINVEDLKEFCNFYYTSQLRRGDLLISVSTRGASPALSQDIRNNIEEQFGPEWEGIVEEVRGKRAQWKKEGFSILDVSKKTHEFIKERGWLEPVSQSNYKKQRG